MSRQHQTAVSKSEARCSALIDYYRKAEAQSLTVEQEREALTSIFTTCLPQIHDKARMNHDGSPRGGILSARLDGIDAKGPRAVVCIGTSRKLQTTGTGTEDGLRITFPRAIPLFMLLGLFGGPVYLTDTTSLTSKEAGAPPRHYGYLFGGSVDKVRDPRLTIERVLADAGPREEVKLGSPHRDLRDLHITKGSAKRHAREEAIRAALMRHAKASRQGKDLGLSAESYEAALRLAFKLFDQERLLHQLKAAAE